MDSRLIQCFKKDAVLSITFYFLTQAVVHKKPGAHPQQIQQPVHYGRNNQEEDNSREY